MAVMLRTLHIPSRVVNGFRTGEFNDLTSQYVVRASNAHSWVEVYFPQYGWITFDPTPSAAITTHDGWSRVLLYIDAMSSFWREWIVNYDVVHQRNLSRQTTRNALEWARQMQDWARRQYESILESMRHTQRVFSDSPGQWGITGAVAIVLLTLAANAGKLWRFVRRRRVAANPAKSPRVAATVWYERAVALLNKRGMKKSAEQTPREFAVSLPGERLRESVDRFTEHYERARFGDSVDDAQQLPELFEEVSAAARK